MEERGATNLRFLPLICFSWLVLTFIVSYAIATSLGHVSVLWPYISDTGTIPPESCVFGLMLNIGSLLMGLVLYIRYKQVKMILRSHEGHNKMLNLMNIFCLVAGVLAAFGTCVVANFQETSNLTIHLIGANLCFGIGSGYFIVQTIICFYVNQDKLSLNLLRTMLCVMYVISFATTLVYAKKSFAEYNVDLKSALLWDSDNPGYDFRLGSTFSEWTLAVGQGLYILSFMHDFKTIGYKLEFSLMNEDKPKINGLSIET